MFKEALLALLEYLCQTGTLMFDCVKVDVEIHSQN